VSPNDKDSNSRLVVAARVALLLAAAAAVVVAVVVTNEGRKRAREPSALAPARYVCPMHPEVVTSAPGACPICRMALEPVGPSRPVSRRERADMEDFAAVENIRKHNIVDFVRRQTPLFNAREMRGPAWVGDDGLLTAVFYKDQVDAMAADETGRFSLSRDPQQVTLVRRAGAVPVAWDESTQAVKFEFAGAGRTAPAAGAVGWLELARRPREMVTVAASAIIQSPEGPYVLVSTGGFAFEKRPIEIGETFAKQGFAVVLAGLHVNERVVARATFFVDANRRLGNPLEPSEEVMR
jgi:hypothetical protein